MSDGFDFGEMTSRGFVYLPHPKEYQDAAAIPQHEPGAKLDNGKVDLTLLGDFARALEAVAKVGEFGVERYIRSGWLSVPNGVSRYSAALLRHLWAVFRGETTYNEEIHEGEGDWRKLDHRAQVAWNALAVLELALRAEEV